jgi:hypothetical protein
VVFAAEKGPRPGLVRACGPCQRLDIDTAHLALPKFGRRVAQTFKFENGNEGRLAAAVGHHRFVSLSDGLGLFICER